jgi:hypothetical protein
VSSARPSLFRQTQPNLLNWGNLMDEQPPADITMHVNLMDLQTIVDYHLKGQQVLCPVCRRPLTINISEQGTERKAIVFCSSSPRHFSLVPSHADARQELDALIPNNDAPDK